MRPVGSKREKNPFTNRRNFFTVTEFDPFENVVHERLTPAIKNERKRKGSEAAQKEKIQKPTDVETGLGRSMQDSEEINHFQKMVDMNPFQRKVNVFSEMVDTLIFQPYIREDKDDILGKIGDSTLASTESGDYVVPVLKRIDSAPPQARAASTESGDDILPIHTDSAPASKESEDGISLKRTHSEPASGDDILSKHKDSASASTQSEDDILWRISPLGNTVLHIVALCGKGKLVEVVAQKVPDLLASKNANDDTPMHVAARAGNISTLVQLLDARLRNLPYSEKPKEALDEILAKNKQGNTFFQEAFLNGHDYVMYILDNLKTQIEAGFKELVERAAFFWTNNEQKSVLHLAIEKGSEDIVDDAMTRLTTSPHPELDELIKSHQELAEMMPRAIPEGKPPLPEQDQGRGMKTQQDDSSMDTTPTSMAIAKSKMMENKELLKITLSMVDWKIMNTFENPLSRNGKHQGLSQDSNTNKSNENREQSTHLIPYMPHYVPPGQSPLIVAILNRDEGILENILTKKKDWIHLRDDKGRTALHYAAFIGYLTGVKYLLENGISCNLERHNNNDLEKCLPYNMVRDNQGFCALHLASAGGHAVVVKKLLNHCTDAREILDNYGRNIAHIAAQMGHYNVVRYILQKRRLVDMINDKDADGNTPLHLATLHRHPKIVHALTWKKKVDLTLANRENQTALDVYMQFPQENPSLRQRLILIALESAGARKYAEKGSNTIMLPPHLLSSEKVGKHEGKNKEPPNKDPYKDRINTLMLVSTLITTVTFAAGFTLPGGTNSSDPGQGMALMLNQVWFKPFIFSITISMYGAVSATIVLIWAQLGDITLTRFALKVAMPLLGITLATLSVAFLAGVHLVISDLSWLATAFLVLCVFCIIILSLLYILLWFFSSSSNIVFRYMLYYPFQFLIWLVEQGEKTEARFVDSSWSTKREGEGKGKMEEGSKR